MAQSRLKTGLAMALVTLLWAQSSAQQPACTPAIVSLSTCLGFVTGNSSTPSSPCCTQLATLVQSQAQCLCTFLSTGATQLGININQTQALTLPGACKIQTPPLSQCNAVAGAPAASPERAPSQATMPSMPSSPTAVSPISTSTPSVPSGSPGTPLAPSVPSIPSGSGSKTVPTAGQLSAAGRSTKFSPSLVFLVLLASSASTLYGF